MGFSKESIEIRAHRGMQGFGTVHVQGLVIKSLHISSFGGTPTVCGSSQARYQIHVTAGTQATTVTTPDPSATAPQENSVHISRLIWIL